MAKSGEPYTMVKNVGAGSTFDRAAFTAYEAVKSERDALKESEAVYKKKVVELELDAENLLKSYQDIYAENKVLRSKVENGPEASRIRQFKTEIKKSEDKISVIKSENELLKEEVYRLQKQANKFSDEKQKLEEAFKMERCMYTDKTNDLEKENKTLDEKTLKFELKIQEYENRIKTHATESDGLLSRYKELKHDNIKMESKFKKQKILLEEEIGELKNTNKEMTKEIIQLKSTLARTQSEFNSIKLANEAAHKQINFQCRELEVFKTQASLLKRNVKVTTREYNTLKEDLLSTENMLEDARNFGFDAVFEERKCMQRRDRAYLKRINNLEDQLQELSRENESLEIEAKECRKNMEAAVIERETSLYKINALKRRIEVLENANLELDRKNKFSFNSVKHGAMVSVRDNKKGSDDRENTLQAKILDLEMQNRKLIRKVRELEKQEQEDDDDFEENVTVLSYRTTRKKNRRIIRADMPSLSNAAFPATYRGIMKTSKSWPSK